MSTESPTPPGQQPPSTWQPTIPSTPVDVRTVTDTYAATLDAAVAAAPEGLAWSDAQASTELYGDVCVVKVARVGTGTFAPDIDALEQSLSAAVSDQGFEDLAIANDPGGAVMFVAHDASDALFEFRSKAGTTVSVRVATVDPECG